MLKELTIIALLFIALTPTYLKPARGNSSAWAVSLDAASTSQTDTAIQSSGTNWKSFRVGAVVNTTNTNSLYGVYGWQFTINYNPNYFVTQGDPTPLATEGNPLGLYPDGAASTVLWGAQTAPGTVNWAGLIAASEAFGSFRVNSTAGEIREATG